MECKWPVTVEEIKLFDSISDTVKEHLSKADSCHDFDHTMRVLHNAKLLLAKEQNADWQVVLLAVLLHDFARPEENMAEGKVCHANLGAKMAAPILKSFKIDETLSRKICEAIRTHRYRSDNLPATIEADIVYDADKLDSLGAIGVARALVFAGQIGARVHNKMDEAINSSAYSKNDTAYREYLVKLRYLPQKMRTASGIKIALERLDFMRQFFIQLNREIY